MGSRLLLTLLAFLVAVCPPFVIRIRAATPATLSASSNSNYTDSTATETTGSVSWTSGDLVLVTGNTEDNVLTTLATPATAGSGLIFSNVVTTNTNNECKMYLWSATASATSSGTITSAVTSSGSEGAGITVWVWTGHNGVGTAGSGTNSTAKTFNYARSEDNVGVVQSLCDWNATGDTTTNPTPSTNATQRCGDDACSLVGTVYSNWVADWTDQGTAGTTAYGVTNHTGTVSMSHVEVEIKGIAAAGGVVPKLTLLGVGP